MPVICSNFRRAAPLRPITLDRSVAKRAFDLVYAFISRISSAYSSLNNKTAASGLNPRPIASTTCLTESKFSASVALIVTVPEDEIFNLLKTTYNDQNNKFKNSYASFLNNYKN